MPLAQDGVDVTRMKPRSLNWATDGVSARHTTLPAAGPSVSVTKWASSSKMTSDAARPRVLLLLHGIALITTLFVNTTSTAVEAVVSTSSARSGSGADS